jgi:hypothetical protein
MQSESGHGGRTRHVEFRPPKRAYRVKHLSIMARERRSEMTYDSILRVVLKSRSGYNK